MGSSGDDLAAMAPWGVVLQEQYANARAVACCPTMDLIAILTVDQQLLVRRTVSWQKVLHVRPSEIAFAIETLAWSPEGSRLAVGGDDGEVVVYDMRTTEVNAELRPPRTDAAGLEHTGAIVAMHWAAAAAAATLSSSRDDGARPLDPDHPVRLLEQRVAMFANSDSTSTTATGDRDAEHSQGSNSSFCCPASATATVLLTADRGNKIGVWWDGRVLVAMIDLGALVSQHGPRHRVADGDHDDPSSPIVNIESMHMSADLSGLFVAVVTGCAGAEQRQVLRLDLTDVRSIRGHLTRLAHVAGHVDTILQTLQSATRQLISEWKNATRVFELKMGLIGSLYEKYGREETPQADMLAVLAGGITSPALAQYFAQDIQEMSVHRMQKMFVSGCESMLKAIEHKLKPGIRKLVGLMSELRGFVLWESDSYAQVLGLRSKDLVNVIGESTQLLTSIERMGKCLTETRHDYGLLFQWLLERIRVHTNDVARSRTNGGPAFSEVLAERKSLLNQRRLCRFMQNAAAHASQVRAPQHKFKVDVTFGNSVSGFLSTTDLSAMARKMEDQWSAIMVSVMKTVTLSVTSRPPFSLSFAGPVNRVQFHQTSLPQDHGSDACNNVLYRDEGDEWQSDESDDESPLGAVDWSSLRRLHSRSTRLDTSDLLISLLTLRGIVLIAPDGNFASCNSRSLAVGMDLAPGVIDVAHYCRAQSHKDYLCILQSTDYGDSIRIIKHKRIFHDSAQPVSTSPNRPHIIQIDLSLVPFVRPQVAASRQATRGSSSHTKRADKRLISQASRGIVCMVVAGSYLTVYDAEDCEDQEEVEDEEAATRGSEDSDVHELDL